MRSRLLFMATLGDAEDGRKRVRVDIVAEMTKEEFRRILDVHDGRAQVVSMGFRPGAGPYIDLAPSERSPVKRGGGHGDA